MTDAPPPPTRDDAALRETMNRVRMEVGKAVVGQDGTVYVTTGASIPNAGTVVSWRP